MQRVGAGDAALAVHGLGSRWLLALLLRLRPEVEPEEKEVA